MQKNDAGAFSFRYSLHLVALAQAGMPVLLNCESAIFSRGTACRARRRNLAGLCHLSRRLARFQNVEGRTLVARALLDGARVACSAFGHGMPCPYCRKKTKNDVTMCAKQCDRAAFRLGAQASFSRAAYRRTPVLPWLSPLGESLVLGWRYRWCSRGAPVPMHWLWKTSAPRRGKCGSYRIPWKLVREDFSLKPTYYFAGLRLPVHLYQRGARLTAHS